MSYLRAIAVSLTLLSVTASAVYAQKPEKFKKKLDGNSERLFDRFDKNKDGALSKDEVPEKLQQYSSRLDGNGDGTITRAEFDESAKKLDSMRDQVAKAGPPGDPAFLMQRLDANSDGKIDKSEAGERLARDFDRLDADKNGSLDRSELARLFAGGTPPEGRPTPEALLKAADKNGDGKLSKDEAPDRMRENFERVDANSDGGLNVEELRTAFARMAGTPGPDGANPEFLFRRFDANGDGSISREEAPEQMKENFARTDSNGDGKLSKEEFAAVTNRMRDYARRAGIGPGAGDSPRKMFNDQDADADGRVTKEEAKGTLKEKFDSLDGNKDGKLDPREVENGLTAKKS